MPKNTKYIFVLGSVLSGLGKGIVTSAIAKNFQVRNKKATIVKIDPYLNIDAGTMNPMEHGETFVTDDGGELDEDFGHYERFLGEPMSRKQNITTGQIYYSVIQKERRGEYLGKTVQVVPHVIDEILLRFKEIEETSKSDIMMVEVGGTIGDIESQPFLEAIRQLHMNIPEENSLFVLVTYVPYPRHISEHKTKPTQHSVRELRASGLVPDLIICRSEVPIDTKTLQKIAFFCDVEREAVLDLPDLSSVFEAPQLLDSQEISHLLSKKLQLSLDTPDWSSLESLLNQHKKINGKLIIGIPGKYTDLVDSYISVNEALKHAALKFGWNVELRHYATEDFESNPENIAKLNEVDGILVPGGFGDRGTEGKIAAIQYSRRENIPFLGICLGFQLAVVEYARNVIGLAGASSTEISESTPYPVVCLQEEQKDIKNKGGTMRLGSYPITLKEGTKIAELYGSLEINERHRHRYEINENYFNQLQDGNLIFTGFYSHLLETLELSNHSYFMGVQYHPEFKSTPWKPSPPYEGLIKAAIQRSTGRKSA
ncbi:MAG: CTP synthase [Candidatus Heimdallarchaeota archaeon]|nr:CTP synthase [Candidatus Heimdallarchaeota archaeon]MDH5644610.1 CTP synthase [Candidatus Heimdallarchaeota archaeon]